MKLSKRLQPLLKLANQEEKNQAILLNKSQKHLQHQRDQLKRLSEYCREYHEQMNQKQKVSSINYQQLNLFLETLYEGKKKQQNVIKEAEQAVNQQRNVWQQAHARYHILLKLIERYQEEEMAALSKQEQKRIEEIVNTMRFYKNHSQW